MIRRSWILCAVFISGSFLVFQLSLLESLLFVRVQFSGSENILLWWTPFLTEQRSKTCGNHVCKLTSNRSYRHHPQLKAVLYYGSSLDKNDLPLRRSDLLWGLFHEESPRNTPLISHEPFLSLFNYTSTFSRFSHLPLTLQFLPSLENITSLKYYESFNSKKKYSRELSPVVYIQSDCSTPNNRDSYVFELMKYINVDSYGECLHNKKLPPGLEDPLKTMMSENLLKLVARYKFTIAFENAFCEDYITEKLWRPLIAGSLPLYIGSPSVKDWVPYNSVLLPLEFGSPQNLAAYLHQLNVNETAYNAYMGHKIFQRVNNSNLEKQFKPIWDTDGWSIIDDFECLLCTKSYTSEMSVADRKHYNCGKPVSALSLDRNTSNWWHLDYDLTECESRELRKYLTSEGKSNYTFDPNNCRL